MRKLMTLTLASSAAVAIACGKDKAPTSTAMSADLQRDIKLASATQDIRINPDEVAPSSKPEVSLKPKKAPQGPKVIRTAHPTVKASAAPVEAAETEAEIPQVQVTAPAPAPAQAEAPAPDLPPLARPSAIPASYPSGNTGRDSGTGTGQGNGGIGGVLGGIFGAVIRGGVVGDDDHCDPRPARRPGSVTDVYSPNGRSIPSGMGGSRIPIRPIGRPRG